MTSSYTTEATVTLNDEEVEVTCVFDYTPADRGSYRDGLQQEPDEPEEMTLCTAKTADGLDVYSQLDDDQIIDLEIAALESQEVDGPEFNEPDYEPDYEPY